MIDWSKCNRNLIATVITCRTHFRYIDLLVLIAPLQFYICNQLLTFMIFFKLITQCESLLYIHSYIIYCVSFREDYLSLSNAGTSGDTGVANFKELVKKIK